jgi:hypothetical protein
VIHVAHELRHTVMAWLCEAHPDLLSQHWT